MLNLQAVGPVLAGVSVGLVLSFTSMRKRVSLDCRDLIKRLHPHQLKGIAYLLDVPASGEIFWQRTHGLSGLRKRWQNHTVLIQLAQVSAERGFADEEDVAFIMDRAFKMTKASRAALIWGLLRAFAPDRAADAGQAALLIYSEMAVRAHTIFSDEAAPLCASMLASVL